MRAKSISGKSGGDIREALNAGMKDGFSPTPAIVFISVKQDRKALCALLKDPGNNYVYHSTTCSWVALKEK